MHKYTAARELQQEGDIQFSVEAFEYANLTLLTCVQEADEEIAYLCHLYLLQVDHLSQFPKSADRAFRNEVANNHPFHLSFIFDTLYELFQIK